MAVAPMTASQKRAKRVARLRKLQREVAIYPFSPTSSKSRKPHQDPRNRRATELLGNAEVDYRAHHLGKPSPDWFSKLEKSNRKKYPSKRRKK